MHSVYCRCDGTGIVPGPISAVGCPETVPRGPSLPACIFIDTLEGTMKAVQDDWIVRGTRGEFYPVKPEPFTDTFEEVEG